MEQTFFVRNILMKQYDILKEKLKSPIKIKTNFSSQAQYLNFDLHLVKITLSLPCLDCSLLSSSDSCILYLTINNANGVIIFQRKALRSIAHMLDIFLDTATTPPNFNLFSGSSRI